MDLSHDCKEDDTPRITVLSEPADDEDGIPELHIPFPTEETGSGVREERDSPNSQATGSSSQQTNSDKLTELPSPTSSPRFRPTNWHGVHNTLERHYDSMPFVHSEGDLQLNTDTGGSPPLRHASIMDAYPHASASEGSVSSHGTQRNKVSFGNSSLPSLHNAKQVFTRKTRGSDPTVPSSLAAMVKADPKPSIDLPPNDPRAGSAPRSRSHSRAASPLRILQQWTAGLHRPHSREEPFVPINPFQLKTHSFRIPFLSSLSGKQRNHPQPEHEYPVDVSQPSPHDSEYCICVNRCFCLPFHISSRRENSMPKDPLPDVTFFITDTFPRQIYLHILLRIPALYFSRVARIFEDAEVSKPDIQRVIETFQNSSTPSPFSISSPASAPTDGRQGAGVASALGHAARVGVAATSVPLPYPDDWSPPLVSPALVRFKQSWETFVDTLMREWKTLNLVSALLLSALLTVFQIDSAATDPVTRNAALMSLTCALMSLSYGCVYIVRFGTMRSMMRASRWAEEARKTNTLIWWNVWVLLAMPAIWLAWSMILFLITILCFVWRTGADSGPNERSSLSATAALGTRIAISAVFLIGLVYFALIIKTLKNYGKCTSQHERWRRLVMMSSTNLGVGADVTSRRGGSDAGNYFHPNASPRVMATVELENISEKRGRELARKHARNGLGVDDVLAKNTQQRQKEQAGSDTWLASTNLLRLDSPSAGTDLSQDKVEPTGLGIH